MSTEENRRQQLLTDVNKLTFSVLQEIKKGEERLIEKVLSDLLKFPPKERHLKKVKKEYADKNTNNFKLFYEERYLGDVIFEMQKEVLDINFKPFAGSK
jgi:hypothetical protein